MDTNKKYAVPALDKCLDVLEYLASQAIPLSQTEIAQAINRSANEIYRILIGLEGRGYLFRDEVSGKYSVSLKLFSLSRKISPIDQIRQTAIPIMEDFTAQSGHASHLSILYQSKVMVIVHAKSYAPLSLSIAEGTLFPTVETTSGRVLLANSNEAVKNLIYERDLNYKHMSESKKGDLEIELTQILDNGYIFRKNTLVDGVTDCAAIVGQPCGSIIAVLTVSTLNSSVGNKNDLIRAVKDTALKITTQVGC